MSSGTAGRERTTGEVGALLEAAREALGRAYALIRNDVEGVVAPGVVLDQVRQCQEVVDVAHAVQTHRLAQHCGTVTHHDPTGDLGDVAGRGGVPAAGSWVDARRFADVAGELRWGPRVAAYRCRDAVLAVNDLPGLVDALADGSIDVERLTAVTTACRDVPEDRLSAVAPMVEQAMLEGRRGGIGCWTATSTRKRARAAVATVEGLAPVRCRARAVRDAVGVGFEPGRVPGTSVMTATVATEQAVMLKAAIEELAFRYEKAGPGGRVEDLSAGQCRAQALVDLVCANATVEANATFLIPVNTPRQALVGRALDGLSGLLARQGFRLSLAPVTAPDPPEWQTDPGDRRATPAELAAFVAGHTPRPRPPGAGESGSGESGQGEPSAPTVPVCHQDSVGDSDAVNVAGGGAHDPPLVRLHESEDRPWAPTWLNTTSDDPGTAHAQRMEQVGERLCALADEQATIETRRCGTVRAFDVERSSGGADESGLPGGLQEADLTTWAAGRPGDVPVEGVGVIHAETAAGLLAALGTTIGRALTDPTTGTVREHTTSAYRPSAGMRSLIRARDGSCRFPGCTRPASFTDADHVIPHAQGGATSPTNLISLCRGHHRAKGSGAWHVTLHEDDTLTWTSLSGTTHTTYPATDPAPF